jgi:branched-chain amino acid transport system permease protein
MSTRLTSGIGAFIAWRSVAATLLLAMPPLLALPLLTNEFAVHVLAISAYYVILAASWNMLAGFTGQFSLAHHGFAALGAYTSGLIVYHLKAPLFISIPSGVLAAAVGGFLLGLLVLHMRAIYLSIATWAFAETLRIFLGAAYEFTRGDLGLSVPSLYGHVRPVPYYYTFLATAVLCLILIHVLLKSPIGYFMRAVRDDPIRAQSLAVDTARVKLFAFVVSSAMAGLAGTLYAHYVLTLTPSIVDFSEMARIVVMVVIGGLGSFIGPIIAAPPVYALNVWLASWGEWSMVAFAATVIVLMRSYPAGLAGLIAAGARRRRGKAASPMGPARDRGEGGGRPRPGSTLGRP